MNDNGENILEELAAILDKHTTNLVELDPDEIRSSLLTIHRVLLVLIEMQERTMKDCGLTIEEIQTNLEILKDAKTILEDEEAALGITMPGGDA